MEEEEEERIILPKNKSGVEIANNDKNYPTRFYCNGKDLMIGISYKDGVRCSTLLGVICWDKKILIGQYLMHQYVLLIQKMEQLIIQRNM